jgi:hypothetical protein
MKIGSIEAKETGLTNGQPAVIVSGKIKQGTVCAVNGLLMLDETTGEFEAHDLSRGSGTAYITLEPIAAETENAAVLLHGTFDGAAVVKADGSALTSEELAAVQKRSQIYFV